MPEVEPEETTHEIPEGKFCATFRSLIYLAHYIKTCSESAVTTGCASCNELLQQIQRLTEEHLQLELDLETARAQLDEKRNFQSRRISPPPPSESSTEAEESNRIDWKQTMECSGSVPFDMTI